MAPKRRLHLDSDESDVSEVEEKIESPQTTRSTRSRRNVSYVDHLDETGENGVQSPKKESDGEEYNEDDQKFPVKLQVGRTRLQRLKQQDEDDEYHVSSSETELSAVESEEFTQSDDGFVVDSDDNVVRRRRTRYSQRRRGRPRKRQRQQWRPTQRSLRRARGSDSEDDNDFGMSIQDELDELRSPSPVHRELRERQPINYEIRPPPTLDDIVKSQQRTEKSAGGKSASKGPIRRLFNVQGPFGGADVLSLINPKKDYLQNIIDEPAAVDQSVTADVIGVNGPMVNADADPLGIDTNIDFTAVGGLDDYIDKLKEMVSLPLMYPDIYKRFGITPPRGVLFHGPPGTGKTLMARALAASASHEGKKITFFMRKGADCLSKWIGEAERQLRLLFEEAKAKQPSIIFFDEIDGLAPVRSSKQEQIHASIVSTLLALMDGMDNRGQVVVIGATNRPDSVDPALRRPGRFDREFYFPLPNLEARRQILKIHTRKWTPPLKSEFVNHVAELTKGYGGADLRALCTEAALAAIQRRYPQIWMSKRKLVVDPESVVVEPRDFLKSLERIVASSARQTGNIAAPLPPRISHLLGSTMDGIKQKLDLLLPKPKNMTALEAAMFDDSYISGGFDRQQQLEELRAARVHRPRLLIHGSSGSGQEYLMSAISHAMEGVFSQVLDFAALFGDSMRTPEASLVHMLSEARRRSPAMLLIPSIELLLSLTSPQLQATLFSILREILPTDKVLVVGIANEPISDLDPRVVQFFGVASTSHATISLDRSTKAIHNFFGLLRGYIESSPIETLELENCPKRALEPLPIAPTEKEHVSEQESKETEPTDTLSKKDLKTLSQLKVKLGAILDGFKNRYRRFRKPVIDDIYLAHLFEEPDPTSERDYILTDDDMVLHVSMGKKYHNMDLDTVEDRLWNGYYCEPRQFLDDLELIHIDSVTADDRDRAHKSSEMVANAQVAIDDINDVAFLQACRDLRQKMARRQLKALAETSSLNGSIETTQPVEIGAERIANSTNENETNSMHDDPDRMVEDAPQAYDQPLNPARPLEDASEAEASELVEAEVVNTAVVQPGVVETEAVEAEVVESKAVEPKAVEASEADETSNHVDTAQGAPNESVSVEKPNAEPEMFVVDGPTLTTPFERRPFELNTDRLSHFFEDLCSCAQSWNLEQLESVFAALADVAWRHHAEWNRDNMLNELESQLNLTKGLYLP
ncbi:Tat-binding 7 [Wickerhamiella sorbophila]|uniref:Tat-binding 7 n=1 Tax=Wickerhamiella sorbophila TaxID=45607 RepID=A0A2T0FM39_9ASCO|nr:Tat-binding 7 [Wickerhamiella sorbophila]PRT56045.1 Tat-binding 7 [Wickerhamiella sorbophila]